MNSNHDATKSFVTTRTTPQEEDDEQRGSSPIIWNQSMGNDVLLKYLYQQILGTPFDGTKVTTNTSRISNTYNRVVDNVSLVNAAYLKTGPYRYCWKNFRKFLQNNSTKPNEHLYVCPGTHGQSEDAQCAPWVEKMRAYDYLDDLSLNQQKSTNVIKKSMDALNFLIKIQNQFIESVFKNKNEVATVELMNSTSGRSFVAIASKKRKDELNYKPALLQDQKTKSSQSDPQKGHINKPFDDDKLIAINQRFFLNKSNGTFQAATLRFLFAWSHFALTRGDDLRTTDTSWGHSGLFELPKEYGPDRGYIFSILKDRSKTNRKGETHFAGCLRHKLVEVCPVNAVGELLILSIGKECKRDFHLKIFDSKIDWIHQSAWLVTDETGSRPLEYSKKRSSSRDKATKQKTRKKKKVDGNSFENEPIYHYEEFQNLITDLDLEIGKVTHIRSMGVRYVFNSFCSFVHCLFSFVLTTKILMM